MSSKFMSFLGVAAVSTLLCAGTALAARVTSDADSIHARELRQRGQALQSDTVLNTDKANHEMLRPGPYEGPMFGRQDQRDDVRPISQDKYTKGQGTDPRRNGTRQEKAMPPRHHYQPDARDQRVNHVAPVRSDADRGRALQQQRDRTPISPEQWKRTRSDDMPFSYHR